MIAWSRPSPDSTHTTSRSSAFGSARRSFFWRRLAAIRTHSFGPNKPIPAAETTIQQLVVRGGLRARHRQTRRQRQQHRQHHLDAVQHLQRARAAVARPDQPPLHDGDVLGRSRQQRAEPLHQVVEHQARMACTSAAPRPWPGSPGRWPLSAAPRAATPISVSTTAMVTNSNKVSNQLHASHLDRDDLLDHAVAQQLQPDGAGHHHPPGLVRRRRTGRSTG